MGATYNGLNVPTTIKTNRIISAFQNEMDYDKLGEYAEIMAVQMLSHEFPPIQGYPVIIDDNEIGDCFLTGEEITEDHAGQLAWMVTDGHHRTLAAIQANLPYLGTELDYSTITNETDFKNYRAAYSAA